MTNTRRLLALLLCAAMTLGLAAVGTAEEAPQKVSIALPLNTYVVDWNTNAYTLALEKEFNVDIEFQLMEDIQEKLPILVTSGSKLPDMICATFSNNIIWNWAQQGVLAPLTKYFNDPEMTQHLTSRVKDLGCDPALVDDMLANVTMPDGEIYTLPSYDQNLWNLMPFRMRVNKAWLDAAGMEMPDTLDEFRDMLRYFRDHDMNGNGDTTDEIPLSGAYGTYGGSLEVWLLGAFIHANPNNNFINVENGKIVPAYTQDAFKDGLAYIRGMYDEGLIDPLAFTQHLAQLKGTINGDVELVGAVCCGSDSNFTTEQTIADYVIMRPVQGPDGVRLNPTVAPTVASRVLITADAQDPALCFRMAEITYGTLWRAMFRNGIEEENWTRDPEKIREYRLQFSTGDYDKVLYMQLESVWSKPNNVIWTNEGMPFFNTQENVINATINKKLADLTEADLAAPANSNFELHYINYVDCQPAELLGTLIHTSEEIEILTEVQAAIDSYAKEMIMAFIVGNASLDQWDAFQSELKAMRLDDYVAVLQAAYDRKK